MYLPTNKTLYRGNINDLDAAMLDIEIILQNPLDKHVEYKNNHKIHPQLEKSDMSGSTLRH